MQQPLGQQIAAQAQIWLPGPVMAVPTVLEKSLQEFIKQGPISREIQRGKTDLSSRIGDLGCKRKRSS